MPVIASTTKRASWDLTIDAIASISFRAPVEVSLWVVNTAFISGCF